MLFWLAKKIKKYFKKMEFRNGNGYIFGSLNKIKGEKKGNSVVFVDN